MEPENELEKHLKALKLSGADSSSFPSPVPAGEEDKYIRLIYRLNNIQESIEIHPSREYFYRNLIR